MSTLMRRIFLCIIGILAGLIAWPIAEVILLFQSSFSSYLIFSIFLGLIFGLFMGGFFGSSEGIIMSIRSNIVSGMIQGALIGIVGGIIGFLIGQGALFIIGELFIQSTKSFNTIGFPVSRAIGWAFLGLFIGIVEGIRSRSFDKIKVGFLGGILGGFIGGLVLEYFRLLIPSIMLARLVGLLIFGLFIGLFYGFVERRLSFGVLRLLNGKFKGKEFLINQKKMKIGGTEKNDIVLSGYSNVADLHAEIKIKGDDVFITNCDEKNPANVNDDKIKEHLLKLEDVIQIGTAKLIFKFN